MPRQSVPATLKNKSPGRTEVAPADNEIRLLGAHNDTDIASLR